MELRDLADEINASLFHCNATIRKGTDDEPILRVMHHAPLPIDRRVGISEDPFSVPGANRYIVIGFCSEYDEATGNGLILALGARLLDLPEHINKFLNGEIGSI